MAITEIRNYQAADLPLLGELYNAVNTRENVTFWWVGEESNWENVYCAFEGGKMVAKGQVEVFNIVPPGRSSDNKHNIFINLRTIPEREEDFELMDSLYGYLLSRAQQLKESFPRPYSTLLCVGNDSSDHVNNQYFAQHKGFSHFKSLYYMERDLSESIQPIALEQGYDFSYWLMETERMEQDYLELEAEVWPDSALGSSRLAQYKQNPLWTAMVIRQGEHIVGSTMAWKSEDTEETREVEGAEGLAGVGVVEDVFVREPWRKRGLAKYLLVQALSYLKEQNLARAELMVLSTNESALSLYTSVGFRVSSEEIRYCVEI